MFLQAIPAQAAAPPTAQRGAIRAAIMAAERGVFDARDTAVQPILDHPLFPYVEYASIKRVMRDVDAGTVEAFLGRNKGTPVAERLRREWLLELGRRGDARAFARHYRPADDGKDAALACPNALLTENRAARTQALLNVWTTGASLPSSCDGVTSALRAVDALSAARIWQRIDLAIAADNPTLVRSLAPLLPTSERETALRLAAAMGGDLSAMDRLADSARADAAISHGIAVMAKADADRAAAVEAGVIGNRLAGEDRGRARAAIALWSAASYLPTAAERFARVPLDAYDDKLHQWRVREAIARRDFSGALKAQRAIPAALRDGAEWHYLAGRLAALSGDQVSARKDLAQAAQASTWHGFMAADQIGADYVLCPLDVDRAAAIKVAADAGVTRAIELAAIDRMSFAVDEWRSALERFDDQAAAAAAARAMASGWTDRGVFTLGRGDLLRHYALRFPLAFERDIEREAKLRRLDPALVAALIRAESAFNPDARSGANARGLMQLIGATAAATAKRFGLRYDGEASLYRPEINLPIGVAHLREVIDLFSGKPYLAAAAYNAGKTPVGRWIDQRGTLEPDLFVETIPFYETREYVARVMAFTVIYDHRMGRSPRRIADRLAGRDGAATRFVCPAS